MSESKIEEVVLDGTQEANYAEMAARSGDTPKSRTKRNIITVPSFDVKIGDTEFRRDRNGQLRPVEY